jgi:hypothetical protein
MGAYRVSCADEAVNIDFESCASFGLVFSLLWTSHLDDCDCGVGGSGVDKIVMRSLMKPVVFGEVKRFSGGCGL